MPLSLSTRWNAARHQDGAALISEIRDLGFETVELGHDLRADLVPGVRKALAAGVVRAASVHNYCPIPQGLTRGGPDLYSPCAPDPDERRAALRHTLSTVEFAAEIGAEWVVMHAGRAAMPDWTGDLIRRAVEGDRPGVGGYDKLRLRLMLEREQKGPFCLDAVRRFLDALLPEADRLGCRLAIELQPTWESVPTEKELFDLLTCLDTPLLGYWHDIGHGQVRENLGLINHLRWLERLEPYLAGLHVHDVLPPARDHLPPGEGTVAFDRFAAVAAHAAWWVLEPDPRTSAPALAAGLERLKTAWPEGDDS